MKIGILGGTFNPVHLGHTAIAECVLKEMNMDKICFLPNGQPPHKKGDSIPHISHRIKMIELAIEEYDNFYISDYEAKQNRHCYTVDTARYFNSLDDNEYYFIIGADSLFQLSTWKDPRELLKICRFIVCNRSGEGDTAKEVERLKNKGCNISLCPMPFVDISSTEIRNMVKDGSDIRKFVNPYVADYIYNSKVYI